jgi:biotin synthase-like enzyme
LTNTGKLTGREQCATPKHLRPTANLTQRQPRGDSNAVLSIKIDGCPEDCKYCSQSMKADSGIEAAKLMDVREVLQNAARAVDAGSQRFFMGAA